MSDAIDIKSLPRELLQRHLIVNWTGPGHKDELPVCGAPEPEFGHLQKTKSTFYITCERCLALTPEGRALIEERTHDYWPAVGSGGRTAA